MLVIIQTNIEYLEKREKSFYAQIGGKDIQGGKNDTKLHLYNILPFQNHFLIISFIFQKSYEIESLFIHSPCERMDSRGLVWYVKNDNVNKKNKVRQKKK